MDSTPELPTARQAQNFIHTAGSDGYLDYSNKPWLEYLALPWTT